MTTLTIIFGYRNREPERVARCLASLAAQTRRDFCVLFVDYGSWPEQANAVRAVVEQHPFSRYIYTDTRGWVWNRSHALNIGVKLAETPYVMTSDVDMLFDPGFVDVLLQVQDDHKIIHCAPRFLPERFHDWDRAVDVGRHLPSGGRGHRGVCQSFPRALACKCRGFDEQYRIWGAEDLDFAERMQSEGLKDTWIEDIAFLFHQWHPTCSGRDRGLGWALNWYRMLSYYETVRVEGARRLQEWGLLTRSEDRAAYRFVHSDSLDFIQKHTQLLSYSYDPADADSITGFLRGVYRLNSGEAMAVGGAKWPPRSELKDRGMRIANGILAAMRISLRFGYPENILHALVNDFIFTNPELVDDYFIQCGKKGDWTVLVRK